MSQTEIEIAFPTQPFGYVHAKFYADSPAEMEGKLGAFQKQMGLAIQIAGGTDSHAQAVRLLKEEFNATVVSEEPAPWQAPTPAVEQPWSGTPAVDPFGGPPVESPGPAPFGADPFAAPANDFFYIDVPSGGLDAWKELRKTLNGSLPRGTIDWDANAKRNTIKRNAPQNILDGLRQRGYVLR